MELDKQNMSRAFDVMLWRFRKNWRSYIKLLFAVLYLVVGYVALVIFAKNNIENCSKPIGLLLFVIMGIVLYVVYVLFNHIVIRKIVNRFTLCLIELLLLLTLIIVIFPSPF